MKSRIAEDINTLGRFCGARDISALKREELLQKYGISAADVMVLFGGSILAGGDILAQAIKDGVAKKYIIVGGEGHTTQTLRDVVHSEYPGIVTAGLPEAEVYRRYLETAYGCHADYIETQSTNCGNNITYLLNLLNENGIALDSIILTQDASMQRRMDAGLRKYVSGATIINYAAYSACVLCGDDGLYYEKAIHGMWTIERYVNLLMGEIPRLTDDENGYGPRGKDFIAHVDIPYEVKAAFDELRQVYGGDVRAANPLYASK